MRYSNVNFYRRMTGALGAFSLLLFVPIHGLGKLSTKMNRPGVIYWHGDAGEKKVALTFDDGPNEPYTSEVLDVLKRYNVRATFFMVGKNVEEYPESARAIAHAGHVIGNHSYSHPDLMLDSNAAVRWQILRTERLIEAATGERPRLFRPPFGGEDFLTRHQASQLGYVMVQWSVSGRDWRKPGVSKIVSTVMNGVHNGSIILLHDGDKCRHGSDRSQTVAALPVLINALRDQGYQLVTVPELLKIED